MAELLTFGEAVQHAGVSRQRLNRAIHSGRLAAERGGGPGKPTRIRFEDLRAWCASEGLSLPVEANARLERSARSARSTPIAPALSSDLVRSEAQQALASLMEPYIERLERSIAQAIERAVDLVVERLAERLTLRPSERAERSARSRRSTAAPAIGVSPQPTKAAIVQRLRDLQAEGLSLQAIANRLNTEGVPTLSGKGYWQKGTIGNLLAQKGGAGR